MRNNVVFVAMLMLFAFVTPIDQPRAALADTPTTKVDPRAIAKIRKDAARGDPAAQNTLAATSARTNFSSDWRDFA